MVSAILLLISIFGRKHPLSIPVDSGGFGCHLVATLELVGEAERIAETTVEQVHVAGEREGGGVVAEPARAPERRSLPARRASTRRCGGRF